MKIIIPAPKSTKRGTALLVALFLCLILSVTIAGYMKHANQQNYLSTRSQSWNLSIAVSEAGVEEAMQQLNSNTGDLAADGWIQSGTIYTTSRTLNSTTRYTVSIDTANSRKPVITSQAFIDTPTLSMNTTAPMFAAVNGQVVPVQNKTISRAVRVTAGRSGMFLKAMVAKHTIDMNGNDVVTDSFDSTDPNHSNNGRYPAGDHTKLLDNGDVASNDNIMNVVNVGNANIFGHVAVGPGGTISVGSQGGVGTYSWQSSHNGIQSGFFTDDMNFTFPTVSLPYTVGLSPSPGVIYTTNHTLASATNTITSSVYPSPAPATGVQTNVTYTTTAAQPSPIPYGLVTNVLTVFTADNSYPKAGTYIGDVVKEQNGNKWDYYKITGTNYTYPTFTFTYSTIALSTNYTVASSSYDYIIQGGAANMPPVDYYVSSLPGGNILVKGNARLVVAGNLDVGGNNAQNQITLNSDARLEMWVGGTSAKLSGNGVINPTGYAQNFMCWCCDSVTDVSLNGNGEFTGILIAPNGNVRLNGGGKAVEDFIGSLLASTIVLNGHFNFHYDEALRNYRGLGRFTITEWNEIPVTTTVSQVNP